MTREEAIQRLKEYSQYAHGIYHNEQKDEEAFDMATEALSGRPQGEWIDSKTAKGYVVCSNCNKLTTNINRKKYNYCPFCGARMRDDNKR